MEALQQKQLQRNELLTLAWPAILEMMLYMAVWVVDTAMVGQVSPIALAAVGMGGQFVFLISWIFSSLGVGATALVARAIGAEDPNAATQAASHAFALSILGSGILAIVGFAVAPLLVGILAKDPEVLVEGVAYARILFPAVIFMVPLAVSSSILRGSGDTRTPLIVAGITNAANIVLDYLLIFGRLGLPALGVRGAAIASAISQVLGFAIMMVVLFRGFGRVRLSLANLFKWERDLLRKLLKLSLPAAAEETSMNIGRTIYIALVARLGTLAFAANQVVVSVESLSFMPGWGFAVASSILVGQSLGAKNKRKAINSGYLGVRYASTAMGAMGLIFFLFPRVILSVFTKDPEVLRVGAVCLRIASLEQIPIAFEMALAGAMRGAGETRYPLFVAGVGNYLVRIPLVYIVVTYTTLGLPAVWGITVIDWSVRAALIFWKYRQGTWARESI